MKKEQLVEVCDKCSTASCWYGEFICDEAQFAGTKKVAIKKLEKLDLESSYFWSVEKIKEVYGIQ